MEEFEPSIIAFVCNWCTYTAADLAGTSRLSYPKNVRLIRVMCTGMVDPQYVIKAFLDDANGKYHKLIIDVRYNGGVIEFYC